MSGQLRVSAYVLLAAALVLLSGPVPYTAPGADLNQDGKVDVADLQCQVLTHYMVTLVGEVDDDLCETDGECFAQHGPGTYCRAGFGKAFQCLPGCLSPDVPLGAYHDVICDDPEADNEYCNGTAPKRTADLNCDGAIGVVDLNFLVAVLMFAVGGPGTPDYDADGRLNFCDNDSDGDGDPDETDCAVLDHLRSTLAPEQCNGKDDNCNEIVDDGLGETTCGLGACQHTIPDCVDGQLTVCDPLEGAGFEICNGLDDDCTGKVDDAPDTQLCEDFAGGDNLVSTVCQGGQCVAAECALGWYDLNGSAADGCECAGDLHDGVNGTCGTAISLGSLPDSGNGALVLTGGNVPGGNGDWYSLEAQDVPEPNTDSFHVRVRFLENPGNAYVFDMYWSSCGDPYQICNAVTDADWATDFSIPGATSGWPALPGPGVQGGGEAHCRPDSNHELTPDNFSDDTSEQSHRCTDNTARFYVRVYPSAGIKPTCKYYKLEVSNAVK